MIDIQNLYQQFLRVQKISTDTRKDVQNSIFFALSGENFNGNIFAEKALGNGAALAVIDDPAYDKGDQYCLVDNTETTLQALAKIHRQRNMIPLIGITGSNGKTTTKELAAAVLGTVKNITYTKGNFNNHIGLPLTLLNINRNTELVVAEMGANHVGEIEKLCHIALPNVGMITNIGKAHLEGFGSYEGVIEAKSELYRFIAATGGSLIVNSDDELLMELSKDINRYTYGLANANLTAQITRYNPHLSIKWQFNGDEYHCNSQLYGKYNFHNILAAIAIGLHYEVPCQQINTAIEQYVPVDNRSQLFKTEKNNLILDAYNANPVSMVEAIRSFKEYRRENPWLILGDMFELGEASLEEHEKIIGLLIEIGFKNVILVGNDFYSARNPSGFRTFQTTPEVIDYLLKNPFDNADILIKGSRGMHLEKLAEYL